MPARSPLLPAVAAAVACLAPLAAAGGAPDRAAAAPATAAEIEAALLREMNRVRVGRGRQPLRTRTTLHRPARAHSRYLLAIDDLRHEGPDGAPFWTRLSRAGFPRDRYVGENLAMVPGCAAGVARRTVALWMRSPGHRANLLDRRFRWAGAGVAVSGDCAASYLTADYGS